MNTKSDKGKHKTKSETKVSPLGGEKEAARKESNTASIDGSAKKKTIIAKNKVSSLATATASSEEKEIIATRHVSNEQTSTRFVYTTNSRTNRSYMPYLITTAAA